MTRLAQTLGLTDRITSDSAAIRRQGDRSARPRAGAYRHISAGHRRCGEKTWGVFGLMIPEQYGGLGESLLSYALCVEELARAGMSLSGVINTHFIVVYMIRPHGIDEQKQRLLPRMATGEARGAFSMSERELGSDVTAIRTRGARADDRGYTITGHPCLRVGRPLRPTAAPSASRSPSTGHRVPVRRDRHVEAAHLMMVNAARLKDSGERNDVAAEMARILRQRGVLRGTPQSFRIHCGYGYFKEYEIERLMRDAPFLLIGEGTSKIQKMTISKSMLNDYRI
jgi:alkylation response protein AidB-like acyl-CoA dehydrogenase